MTKELKPCPHCGATPNLCAPNDKIFWVECPECGGCTYPTQEEAISVWNSRNTEVISNENQAR